MTGPLRKIVRPRRPSGFRIARRIYWIVVVGDDVRLTGKHERDMPKTMIAKCAGFSESEIMTAAGFDLHPSTARKKDAEKLLKAVKAARKSTS